MAVYFVLALSLTLVHFRVSHPLSPPPSLPPSRIFAVLCGTPFSCRCSLVPFFFTPKGGDSSMAQLMYELCFCLWSVSLCDEVKQDFMSCGAIPILAQQVRHRIVYALVFFVMRKPTCRSRCCGWVSICA